MGIPLPSLSHPTTHTSHTLTSPGIFIRFPAFEHMRYTRRAAVFDYGCDWRTFIYISRVVQQRIHNLTFHMCQHDTENESFLGSRERLVAPHSTASGRSYFHIGKYLSLSKFQAALSTMRIRDVTHTHTHCFGGVAFFASIFCASIICIHI